MAKQLVAERKQTGSSNTGLLVGLGAASLAVLGVVLLSKKSGGGGGGGGGGGKKPGDQLTAVISFNHSGTADVIWAGVGFALKTSSGHGPISSWAYAEQQITQDNSTKQYTAPAVTQLIPNLGPGSYSYFVFLQKKGGALNPDGTGFYLTSWYDNQFTV